MNVPADWKPVQHLQQWTLVSKQPNYGGQVPRPYLSDPKPHLAQAEQPNWRLRAASQPSLEDASGPMMAITCGNINAPTQSANLQTGLAQAAITATSDAEAYESACTYANADHVGNHDSDTARFAARLSVTYLCIHWSNARLPGKAVSQLPHAALCTGFIVQAVGDTLQALSGYGAIVTVSSENKRFDHRTLNPT